MSKTVGNVQHLPIADARRLLRHVFIRDLVLDAHIGIHHHEKNAPQRVRLNIDLSVAETPLDDAIDSVVCYEALAQRVRGIIAASHINLVETLAEYIADAALEDPRVTSARVRVEKLDAIANAASVGVEIERMRPPG
jgi:dihydroneopterin aldolase